MKYIRFFSELLIPLMILIFVISGIRKKMDVFKEFTKGIKESVYTVLNIFPAVAGIMIAIGMMRASGLLTALSELLSPLTDFFNISSEIVQISLLRPLSGSGGLAMLADIIKNSGPDSLTGMTASVICAATETTFYTIAVYFGAIEITDTRHTIKCALIADTVSIVSAIIISKLLHIYM